MTDRTRYFLDTEFIEDGITIDLISIGVVCEDGREFYREVHQSGVPWHHANPWVRSNVRPHLVQAGNLDEFDVEEVVRTRSEIALDLVAFVTAGLFRPEFWGYYADYDWVVVAQLYGTMMDLPSGWPMFCMDLKQLAVSKGDPELPKQTTTEHHALADARWNQDVWRWLTAHDQAGGS